MITFTIDLWLWLVSGGFIFTTIIGIADYDTKPSVSDVQVGDHLVAVDGIPVLGSTMGQVWLMLGGEPGKERRLTVERNGKLFTVMATVRHFLAERG